MENPGWSPLWLLIGVFVGAWLQYRASRGVSPLPTLPKPEKPTPERPNPLSGE